MFNRDDYMTPEEIAADWRVSPATVRRWIRKGYADSSAVEVHGGRYFVHREEVHRWKAAYEGKIPVMGMPVPFKKLPDKVEQPSVVVSAGNSLWGKSRP